MTKHIHALVLSLALGPLAEAQPASPAKRLIAETDVAKFIWSADPQVSPDGKTVAFVRVDANEKKDDYETSVWIAASASLWRLACSRARAAAGDALVSATSSMSSLTKPPSFSASTSRSLSPKLASRDF